MTYEYEYPRAALTVDCVVLGRDGGALKVLLIRRGAPPFQGAWALPGGFLELDETLEQAAIRELEEETGVRLTEMEQLRAFDAIDRDPRERVISVAHMAVVDVAAHSPKAGDDAGETGWFALDALPPLAFDHAQVLALARERLPGGEPTPIGARSKAPSGTADTPGERTPRH
jgi:8-oxo-dGTP diphosphatase